MAAKKKPEAPKLAEFLCFAVYSANLAYGRTYKPLLEKLGLTYTQFITIVALAEADYQRVSDLGAKLMLESNTLTPVLKKLEAMGYVERGRDPKDERQVRVSLTAAGRALHRRGLDNDIVAATGLAPDELAKVQASVIRLRDNLIKASSAESDD